MAQRVTCECGVGPFSSIFWSLSTDISIHLINKLKYKKLRLTVFLMIYDDIHDTTI